MSVYKIKAKRNVRLPFRTFLVLHYAYTVPVARLLYTFSQLHQRFKAISCGKDRRNKNRTERKEGRTEIYVWQFTLYYTYTTTWQGRRYIKAIWCASSFQNPSA